jgi:hypothetical protein
VVVGADEVEVVGNSVVAVVVLEVEGTLVVLVVLEVVLVELVTALVAVLQALRAAAARHTARSFHANLDIRKLTIIRNTVSAGDPLDWSLCRRP